MGKFVHEHLVHASFGELACKGRGRIQIGMIQCEVMDKLPLQKWCGM